MQEVLSSETSPRANPGATLSKAVVRAARFLDISQTLLAEILGLSEATVSRLTRDKYQLRTDRKEWQFALLFIRLFRSLDALLGHDEQARTWLRGANTGLGASPIDLLTTPEGLVRVVNYLDAYRARI
jgi:uncharacterized protein (DUF2384 family)